MATDLPSIACGIDSHTSQRPVIGPMCPTVNVRVRSKQSGDRLATVCGRILVNCCRRAGQTSQHWRIVHWRDVDGHGGRCRIQIDTAIDRTTIILYLEGKRRCGNTTAIPCRDIGKLVARYICHRYCLACSYRYALELKGTDSWQSRNCNGHQRIRRTVTGIQRITEAKIRDCKGIEATVFRRKHGRVNSFRSIINGHYRYSSRSAHTCITVNTKGGHC